MIINDSMHPHYIHIVLVEHPLSTIYPLGSDHLARGDQLSKRTLLPVGSDVYTYGVPVHTKEYIHDTFICCQASDT